MGRAVLAFEISTERTAGGIERGVVQRGSPGDAANTIGTEEFFGHGESPSISSVTAMRPSSVDNP
jgi:hypothetical protein